MRTRPHHIWKLPRGSVALGERTLLMGILNLTPDSFSDGGLHTSPEAAVTHGLILLDGGADLLDLGAESTRPNATPLSAAEEQARLLPALTALRRARPDALLSVDTYHAATAHAALALGADCINDVSGLLWDRDMAPSLAAATPAPGLVLMHARGTRAVWSSLPSLSPGTVLPLVRDDLRDRLAAASAAGIPLDTIVLDPGFGFGKAGLENYDLLAHLAALQALGRPLLIGLSRKRFLAEPSPPPLSSPNDAASESRLYATIAANTAAILAGAHVLRVHDIPAARAAASVADRILQKLDPFALAGIER